VPHEARNNAKKMMVGDRNLEVTIIAAIAVETLQISEKFQL
jgi:hypothetical protein